MLKVYLDESHYSPDGRYYLCEVARVFWYDKMKTGRSIGDPYLLNVFEEASSLHNADICILPMYWSYYLKFDKVKLAERLAAETIQAGKSLVVWALGDFNPIIPFDSINLKSSLLRSTKKRTDFGYPSLFGDYKHIYRKGQLNFRSKQAKPTIGFCGQGSSSRSRLVLWVLRNAAWSFNYHLGRSQYLPPPLLPHTILRSRVLSTLARSKAVNSNFVIRDKYLAGVAPQEGKDAFNQAKREFIDNIDNSDYTVCVRGTGNFSMRFYETLCLGRIPIFVDTDCVLPYDFAVDWKQYCVWINRSEIPHISEKVADFHARLSSDDFVDLQRACRQIWEERLSVEGFYSHFHEHFVQPEGLS